MKTFGQWIGQKLGIRYYGYKYQEGKFQKVWLDDDSDSQSNQKNIEKTEQPITREIHYNTRDEQKDKKEDANLEKKNFIFSFALMAIGLWGTIFFNTKNIYLFCVFMMLLMGGFAIFWGMISDRVLGIK